MKSVMTYSELIPCFRSRFARKIWLPSPAVFHRSCPLLTTYKYTIDKNLVSNQDTLQTVFDSSRFGLSDGGPPPVKTYANQRALLEEKTVAHSGLEPINL